MGQEQSTQAERDEQWSFGMETFYFSTAGGEQQRELWQLRGQRLTLCG